MIYDNLDRGRHNRMTDLLREAVRSKHQNLNFAGIRMQEIERYQISNGSEVFTQGGYTR